MQAVFDLDLCRLHCSLFPRDQINGKRCLDSLPAFESVQSKCLCPVCGQVGDFGGRFGHQAAKSVVGTITGIFQLLTEIDLVLIAA